MILQDLRVGFRILAKEPAYSVVSILGLGVGLSVCLLLLGYAHYCWSYDSHLPDAQHVYIVKQRNNVNGGSWSDQAPLLLRKVAMLDPAVTAASGYVNWFPLTVQVDGQLHKLRSLTVLPGFAEMMGLRAIEGDLSEALSRPDSFAITESAAVRLFGTSNALGRALPVDTVEQQKGVARVAAILRDPPANTTIPFETINGLNFNVIPQAARNEALDGEKGWLGNLLIRVRPEASLAAVSASLQLAIDRAPALQNVAPEVKEHLGDRKVMDIKLSPIRDAYFDREIKATAFSLKVDRGNPEVVAGLVVIGILILGLAAINYVNLATIRVVQRHGEIAMRKVLGASKSRIAVQFVVESVLVSMLATGLGTFAAFLALPIFSEVMNRDLRSIFSIGNVAATMLIGFVLGSIIAIYPAWIAFGVRPSQLLAGRPDIESLRGKRLRQGLSILQLSAAMGLASFAMAVYFQTRFAIDASPGFDPTPLLVFDLPESQSVRLSERARSLITAITAQPGVAGVGISSDPIGRARNPWSTEIKREGGDGVTMDVKSVMAGFFDAYALKPLAGRLFDARIDKEDDPVPMVINQIAARKLGFESPEQAVGQTLLLRNSDPNAPLTAKRVIGIAPEVRFYSLRETPTAVAYELWTNVGTLTVRANGPVPEVEQSIRRIWFQYYPNSVLNLSSAKDIYASNYADDARLAKLLALSTAIALTIAAFGAYVLAADAVHRRTREIALRKLYGAARRDIARLIAREVGTILLLSAIIALPVAAITIGRYLSGYVQHSTIAYWTLAIALVIAVTTATLAASRQAFIAMLLRPADALRN